MVALIKNRDDIIPINQGESHNNLLNHHFPGFLSLTPNIEGQEESIELDENLLEIITPEIVKML